MNKNFNEIYEEIYESGTKEIEKLRKQRTINTVNVIIFSIIFIFIIYLYIYIGIKECYSLIGISFFILMVNSVSAESLNRKYREIFKGKIIRRIVQCCDDKFIYNPKIGIKRNLYDKSQYNKHYDKYYYYSEDLISGEIFDNIEFQMSQVRIFGKTREKDKNWNIKKRVLFDGLYGIVDFENIEFEQIDVMYDSTINRLDKDRIEIDSAEFEQNYDMMSKDKIQTMQIFTPDIINEINKFKKDTGSEIQIRILKNNIFFKIRYRDAFEPPAFKNALDFSTLYGYFRVIDGTITIITKIVENIKENKMEV